MGDRLAVVFPGQGTSGVEGLGEAWELALGRAVGGEVPYQLRVFAGSVDLFFRLREAGVSPEVVAGHSLGEYAAAVAAGSLALEDAVGLVAERDRLMTEASRKNPGVMVAVVGADPQDVLRAAEETEGVVVAANFNSPRQTVLSGEPGAVEAAAGKVGGRKIRLNVAGAFHSPLMQEAALEMETLLAGVSFRDPEVPVIGGSDGAVLRRGEDVRLALQRQMLAPVRWVAVVERMLELGVAEVVEAGEDGTLTRMLRDFRGKGLRGRRAGEVLAS